MVPAFLHLYITFRIISRILLFLRNFKNIFVAYISECTPVAKAENSPSTLGAETIPEMSQNQPSSRENTLDFGGCCFKTSVNRRVAGI